jgi:DNA-binding FadR family transcriptional regulator
VPTTPVLLSLVSHMSGAAEMVELRRVLEVGLIDLVIDKARAGDIEELEGTIDGLEAAANQPEVVAAELAEHDLAFHYRLLELTGDRSLIELGRLIMRLFTPSIASHLESGGVTRAVRDHRRILAAVAAKDRSAARDAVITSYNQWKKHIKVGALSRREAGP